MNLRPAQRLRALRSRGARLLDPHPPAATAPNPGASNAVAPIAGTYVGNGRLLVYLETGGRLFVSADDLSLVPELLRHGIYDVPFTRFLHRALGPGSTFVDVGANAGLFSVIGGHVAWRGRVIAYEPVPALQALIRDNIATNWFADRVALRPVAVGAAPGRATFGFPTTMQGLGRLNLQRDAFDALHPDVPIEEVTVEVVRLDDELADVGVVDLVKIDVEGGEAAVLAGMRGCVERRQVRRVSLEVRKDVAAMNDEAGWTELVGELRHLAGLGAAFGRPDDDGDLVALRLDEVLDVGLYSNLVITLPA